MGNEIAKPYAQGVVLQDERMNHDAIKDKGVGATDSAYTETGPRPGVPVPVNDTYCALEASGEQGADGHIEVQTLRAGHPGPERAGIGFRDVDAGDGAAAIKGHDPFVAITGWLPVHWTTTASPNYHHCDVIRMKSGKLMMCGQTDNTGLPKIYIYDPDTSAWSAGTDPGVPADAVREKPSCLVLLPSGRVLLITIAPDTSQVDVYRTDDEGTTWTLHASSALERNLWDNTSNNPDPKRLTAAYSNDEIVLFVWYYEAGTVNPDMAQYVSDDLGGIFHLVEDMYAPVVGQRPYYPDITAIPGGGFLLGCVENNDIMVRKLYSASHNAAEVSPTNLSNSLIFSAPHGLTTWTDEDGIIYLAVQGNLSGGDNGIKLFASRDGGESWPGWEQTSPPVAREWRYNIWYQDNQTEYFHSFSCASTGGRAFLCSRFTAVTGNYREKSVVAIELGGFSSHTVPCQVPSATYGETYGDMYHFGHGRVRGSTCGLTYMPISLPNAQGWTRVAVGGTESQTAVGELQCSTGLAQTNYYHVEYTYDLSKTFAEFAVQVDSGGSVANDDVSVLLQLSDGATYGYQVIVRFSTTQYRFIDPNGAVLCTVNLDMTSRKHIRVALEKGDAHVFHAEDGHIRDWVEGGGGSVVDDGGANGNRDRMEWGNRGGGNAAVSKWSAPVGFGFYMTTWTERSKLVYAAGWSNPTDVHPKSLPTLPYNLKSGLKVRASSGPTKLGDKWDCKPIYTYPLSALDVNLRPSPGEPWRSLTDSVAVQIVWQFEDLFTDTFMENYSLAAAFRDINFQTCKIQGWDTAGLAWDDIIVVDAASGMSGLAFTRKGRILRPDQAQVTTGSRYLFNEAHAGDTVKLSAGESALHKIAHNTEGAWRGSGVNTKIPSLTLDTAYMDGTEAASGTLEIWRRNVLALRHAYNSGYELFRLLIPAQSTADGYFQIGSFLFGPCAVFGRNHSRGYSTLRNPNVEIIERTNRSYSSRKLGDRRREYELSWSDDAVDNTQVDLTNPNPDYIAGQAGGAAIATPHDTIRMLEGVLDRVEHRKPLVLVRNIPQAAAGGSTTKLILDDRWWMLCRAENPINTKVPLGTEGVDEVERADTVTFYELN